MHLSTRSVSFLTVASLGTSCPRLARGLLPSIPKSTTTGSTSGAATAATRHYLSGAAGAGGGGDDQSVGADSSKQKETCVISAALAFLKGTKQIVEGLNPADYCAVDEDIGASVGVHCRHILDHFSKCIEALPSQSAASLAHEQQQQAAKGAVDPHARFRQDWSMIPIRYDQRVRGGTVESDPAEAANVIANLQTTLKALPRGLQGSLLLRKIPVSPTFLLEAEGGGEHVFQSNLERELFFCCHHGHHHDAIIRLILERMASFSDGARVLLSGDQNKTLGVAPSTASFRKQQGRQQQQQQHDADDDGVTTW